MINYSKLKKENCDTITAEESRALLDNWIVETVIEVSANRLADLRKGANKEEWAEEHGAAALEPEGPEVDENSFSADSFALMMSKMAGRNETAQSLIFVTSTIAVLEGAKLLFDVGSGFVKLDMQALTLRQIKETLKTIEEKVDVILSTPLKQAIAYFNKAVNKIQTAEKSHDFEKACEFLNKSIEYAIQAFHYGERKSLSIQEFDSSMKAMRLQITSTVLVESYSKEQEQFVPFETLSTGQRRFIAIELEDIVMKSLELLTKVNTKTATFFSNLSKEAKTQDILDSVLKLAYPYLSDIRGWTNFKTLITQNQKTLVIQVMPMFLPFGEDDAVVVKVGVRQVNNVPEIVKMKLWRDKHQVYGSSGINNGLIGTIIDNERIVTSVKLIFTNVFVISINGLAEEWQGQSLGQYEYNEGKKCLTQTSTEKNTPRHIYQVTDGDWYVNDTPGEAKGWLMNTSKSATAPTQGWKVSNGTGTWLDDPTVTLTPEHLEITCNKITIKTTGTGASKFPECLGEFIRLDRWINGRPFFMNNRGRFLHVNNGGYWSLSSEMSIGSIYTQGAPFCPGAPLCPKDCQNWKYFNGYELLPAKIEITCGTHNQF